MMDGKLNVLRIYQVFKLESQRLAPGDFSHKLDVGAGQAIFLDGFSKFSF